MITQRIDFMFSKIYFPKFILFVIIVFSVGAVLGIAAFLFDNSALVRPPIKSPAPKVNAIEISADQRAIINSDTKEIIFTIEGAQAYLERFGYLYNPDTFQTTPAKYEGNCFLSAALSNSKDRFVFSAGCLAGDLPQPWIGIYDLSKSGIESGVKCGLNSDSREFGFIPKASACAQTLVQFLIGGSGKNFIWSDDDTTITYEADLGLSGMTETRTIDSGTGDIIKNN